MSLGVLNNLSAVYAENNLNNSNNSLNTVLQQLSSGSKINSGADDAAGLSLVDGLQANQTALTQSVTNAKEGVGLLQVADGALSQVTSLLNRAVTLATEASNGTLNASQDTAANQEYQSILSEISNIGSTTTYNAQQVFNSKTDIYTGDSSTSGSSIDALNIRTLSSSNVGDSGGMMAYSSGSNSVFINLSSGAVNAQSTDTLNASGNTSIDVNYLVKGANGTETAAVATISVGGASGFTNTANGLISAINNAGLGLTASFTTASQAGVAGGTTQTGIQITGGLVAVGTDPNAVSTSGILNPGGITNQDFNLGQTITVTAGGTTAASFVIGSSTNTLVGLAAAINSGTGAGAQAESVTASVITNGNGSQSIALSDASGGGLLGVNVTGGQGAQSLSNPTAGSPTSATNLAFTQDLAGVAGTPAGQDTPGRAATGTLAFTSGYTANSGSVLGGTIVLSNGTAGNMTTDTFVMGGTTGNGTIAGGTTLGSLATAIGSALGVATSVTSNGLTMTANNVGTTITMGTSALTTAPAVNVANIVNGISATVGSHGTTTLSMVGGSGFDYSAPSTFGNNDVLTKGTTLVISNGTADSPGAATSFVIGGTSGGNVIGVGASNSNSDLTTLLAAIDSGPGATATGISNAAVNSSGQIVLTSSNVGSTITIGAGSNLADQQAMSVTLNSSTVANNQSVGGNATIAIAGLTSATANVLAGSIVIGNGMGGAAQTFVMGNAAYNGALNAGAHAVVGVGPNANTWTVNGNTMDDLNQGINAASAALGITATDAASGITLAMTSGTAYGSSISVTGTGTLTDNYVTSLLNVQAGNGTTTYDTGTLAMTNNGASNITTDGGTLTGTLVLTSNVGGGGNITDTFVMGNSGGLTGDTTGNTWDVAGNTVAALRAAINDAGGVGTGSHAAADLNLTATVDAASGGLKIVSNGLTDTGLVTTGSTLTADIAEVGSIGTQGQVQGGQATGFATGSASTNSTITFGGSGTLTVNDVLSAGSVVIVNGAGGTLTFAMGAASATSTSNGHTTITTNGYTLGALQTAITTSTLGISASIDAAGTGLQLATTNFGTSISVASEGTITDNYATQFTTPASGSTDNGAQYQGGLLTLTNGGKMSTDNGTLAGTIKISTVDAANAGGYTATFTMGGQGVGGLDTKVGSTWNLSVADSNMAGLEAAINGTGGFGAIQAAGVAGNLNVVASTDTASGGIFIQSATNTDSALGAVTTGLTDNNAGTDVSVITAGHNAGNANVVVSNIGTNNQGGDTVTGSIVLFNSLKGQQTTFTMGGAGGQANGIVSGSGTQNILVSGTTLNNLINAIGNSNLDLTAQMMQNGTGLSITSSDASGNVTAASTLIDQYTGSATVNGGNAPGQATDAVATLGTGVANINASTNVVTGAVVISNNGVTDTFTMANSAGSSSAHTFTTGSENLTGLAQAINADTNLGLSASVSNGMLNMLATTADTSITIASGTNTLAATFNEGATLNATQGTPIISGQSATNGNGTTATFALGAGSLSTLSGTDVVTGSIAISANGINGGNPITFTMGATADQVANQQSASHVYIAGNQLSSLEGAIGGALNVAVQGNGTGSLILTSNVSSNVAIASTGSLQDFGGSPVQSSATLGTFANESDTVSGTISLTAGNGAHTLTFTNEKVSDLLTTIDQSSLGVTASYAPSNGAHPTGYGNLVLTSNSYGAAGNITATSGTTITDTTAAATVSYVGANAYSTGISNSTSAGTALYDKSSQQTNPTGTLNSSFVSNASGGSGIATISYSDGAGVSLNATDLSQQTDAESALTSLNSAITSVAAQDGYIGAQINTLNAVSQVLSTQQENVQAAQNAVQATDYASATSNMSKYEILSQTGIAALAQANSIQQEVTKLLQ